MNLRRQREAMEDKLLSPFATRSADSKGRRRPEKECSLRPAFQHDRDRILYCKSFRRLKHKTQVFLAPTGDHYRTRLTHTLEVSQIARTLARCLGLNEDLVEAVSLGHDLGHTPFGHAGESKLNKLMQPGGFRHYDQSLRVVDHLEKEGRGLNLTHEVRQGIAAHSKGRGRFMPDEEQAGLLTLEAQVVRAADIMAYIAHDTDDAIRGGVIKRGQLPKGPGQVLGRRLSKQIDTMVRDLVEQTMQTGGERLAISPAVEDAMWELRDFLYDNVYDNPEVHSDFIKAEKIIEDLYTRLMSDDAAYERLTKNAPPAENRSQKAADYIAGMTDHYAMRLYREIFWPHPWAGV